MADVHPLPIQTNACSLFSLSCSLFLFFYIYTVTLGNKYRRCCRGRATSIAADERVELAQSTTVVTVWHEGAGAGCRATSRVTRRTHVGERRGRRGHVTTLASHVSRTPDTVLGQYIHRNGDLSGGALSSARLSSLLPQALAEGIRTDVDDGAEAADAHREREGDEEHHATGKRPQVVEIARGGISGWALALGSVSLCRLWICRVSNHPEYQNGLKMREMEALLLIFIPTNQLVYNSSICERD